VEVGAAAPIGGLNTTPSNRSVQSGSQRENRSVQLNTTVLAVNTTPVNTTNEWDAAPNVQAVSTGKRIEIRYNKRKSKEPYYRWAAEENGKPVKRPSGTYIRKYEYGGKLSTIAQERLDRYEARK
jgi:hypothetical protein